MTGIIIVTHGKFGEELLRSVSMVVGEYDKVRTVSFNPGDSLDELKQRVEELVADETLGKEKLILVDLYAGSPFNASLEHLRQDNVEIVTGVNFPMLIECLTQKDSMGCKGLKCKCIETRDQIKSVREILEGTAE